VKRLTALFLAIAVAAATPAAGQCNDGSDDPLCGLPPEVREAIRAGGDRADREYPIERDDGDGGGDGDEPRNPCERQFTKE